MGLPTWLRAMVNSGWASAGCASSGWGDGNGQRQAHPVDDAYRFVDGRFHQQARALALLPICGSSANRWKADPRNHPPEVVAQAMTQRRHLGEIDVTKHHITGSSHRSHHRSILVLAQIPFHQGPRLSAPDRYIE